MGMTSGQLLCFMPLSVRSRPKRWGRLSATAQQHHANHYEQVGISSRIGFQEHLPSRARTRSLTFPTMVRLLTLIDWWKGRRGWGWEMLGSRSCGRTSRNSEAQRPKLQSWWYREDRPRGPWSCRSRCLPPYRRLFSIFRKVWGSYYLVCAPIVPEP